MLPRFLALLYLLPLSRAASTNTTTNECPDGTPYDYRSVWNLMASCGLTMLVCVWHAIHPSVPLPHYKSIDVFLYRLCLMLVAFFAPEWIIAAAFDEWLKAKALTKRVHNDGHEWWTMTHSHFVLIGGFALCDDTGTQEINSDEFLSFVDRGVLVNPVITEEDIKDKSTSDSLGKAILIVQLSWFTVQTVARLVNHLAVTLVELDTVCMALLTVPLIFLWWKKPRCPGRPHIFYMRNVNNYNSQDVSQRNTELEPWMDGHRTIKTKRDWEDLWAPAMDRDSSSSISLWLTWSLFGVLHTIAWNYDFPTAIERTLWRVSSLALTGMPIIYAVTLAIVTRSNLSKTLGYFILVFPGVVFRLLLAVLLLASLRSLPPSAYRIVPWTDYIPHL